MKFKFNLTAGWLIRKQIRRMLDESKDTLEYHYGGQITIREDRSFLETTFYVQGTGFPDTDDFQFVISNWSEKIERAVSDGEKFNENMKYLKLFEEIKDFEEHWEEDWEWDDEETQPNRLPNFRNMKESAMYFKIKLTDDMNYYKPLIEKYPKIVKQLVIPFQDEYILDYFPASIRRIEDIVEMGDYYYIGIIKWDNTINFSCSATQSTYINYGYKYLGEYNKLLNESTL